MKIKIAFIIKRFSTVVNEWKEFLDSGGVSSEIR